MWRPMISKWFLSGVIKRNRVQQDTPSFEGERRKIAFDILVKRGNIILLDQNARPVDRVEDAVCVYVHDEQSAIAFSKHVECAMPHCLPPENKGRQHLFFHDNKWVDKGEYAAMCIQVLGQYWRCIDMLERCGSLDRSQDIRYREPY